MCASTGLQIHSTENYNDKSCLWGFCTILLLCTQDLVHIYIPPLHTHASSLRQGETPQRGRRLCLLCIYIFPLGDRQMGQWTEPQTDS